MLDLYVGILKMVINQGKVSFVLYINRKKPVKNHHSSSQTKAEQLAYHKITTASMSVDNTNLTLL